MNRNLSRLSPTAALRRFARDGHGTASVELVLVLPLLLWALAATVVFFDGYKTRYHAEMAAQTVADIMSRETDMFTAAYVEGLNGVYDFLADSRYQTRIRVSSVIWDPVHNRNRLQWSYGTRGLSPLPEDTFERLAAGDTATLLAEFGADESFSFAGAASQMPVPDLANRIPPVLPGEALLMVETFALWSPFASVGVGQLRFAPVVVVRPRFAPWVNFDGIDPVFPEADYELAWTGAGNTELPDPTDPVDPVVTTGTIINQTFNAGAAAGWTQTTITQNGPTGGFLGPFGMETNAAPVSLPVNLGSTGKTAQINFDLIALDSWDGFDPTNASIGGDSVQIMLDGVPITMDVFQTSATGLYGLTRTATVYQGGALINVTMTLGQRGTNFVGSATWWDQIWRVSVTIENAPQRFTLGFSATTNSSAVDEAFGIDNLLITASAPTTPASAFFTPNPAMLTGTDSITRFRTYSGCPDGRLPAPFVQATADTLGTTPRITRNAGGTAYLPDDCAFTGGVGWMGGAPAMVLNYDTLGRTDTLVIRTNDSNNGSTCDSTLLVRDPSGQWLFNDDQYGLNAGVIVPRPNSGRYTIYVGTWSRQTCRTAVQFTTR